MSIPPSYRVHKAMKQVAGDNAYFNKLEERQQYLREMERSMSGVFGTTLIAALEQMESQAYSTLYKSGMKCRVNQSKAEIKTVQYIKGILAGFIAEKQNLANAIEQFNEENDHEL